jgi:alkanesulfonate monooxygenase SsuD/methylene tetrahydromethanopterin reductase-like flavin-dependent oxidoreductase (luciferase family)
MTARSCRVQVGVCLPIFACPGNVAFRTPAYPALDVRVTVEYGVLADELGYDSLWLADHLQLGKDGAILEGWTTLAVLAGRTRRAKLGTIHLSNAFRHPPLAAKMAATLDQLSGGRLIFFYDAGWGQTEIDAYGFDFPDAEARLGRMREGLEIARRLWTQSGPITFEGKHYHVREAICEPKPIQRPHPPIWTGEARYDGLVDLAAELGQGWNSVPVSPTELSGKLASLQRACDRAGRDFAELEISLETQILVAPSHAELDQTLERIEALRQAEVGRLPAGSKGHLGPALDRSVTATVADWRDRWLLGTPAEVVDQIRVYHGLGVSHLMLWFLDAPDPAGVRLFAEKVRPALS